MLYFHCVSSTAGDPLKQTAENIQMMNQHAKFHTDQQMLNRNQNN